MIADRHSIPRIRCLLAALFVALCGRPASAQSFSQVLDLGNNVGARLTRSVTLDRINSSLFAIAHDQALWVDATGSSPVVFSFASDPVWSKVVFSRRDSWIRGFNDWSAADPLIAPRGLDVSGSRKLFITDPPTRRVVVATLDEAQKRLIRIATFSNGLTFPVAVAWDGGSSPLTNEAVYVVDGSAPFISYWTKSGSTWIRAWSYGQAGGGTGQFSGPTAVCVGHSASSPSGSSTFGPDFYVVDAGNRRVVWLRRDGTSATWKGERTLYASPPETTWLPVSCTVDHFGVVYVADRENSKLVSLTWYLDEITRYGTYGTGATNYNTFAHPHDVHIPFGKKTVGGQTIWYGEGRILTAEDWGPGSGGLEHWLGVEIPFALASGTPWGPEAFFRTTGTAYLTVTVHQGWHQAGDPVYLTVWNGSNFYTPATLVAPWDGHAPDGNSWAPVGMYHFHVTATSAYGCQGEAWCQTTAVTTPVRWEGPGSCQCEWPDFCIPCEENVALLPDVVVAGSATPSAYRLGQVLTTYTGPLVRLEGMGGGAAASAALSPTDAMGSVRAYGIRALAVDVPREAAGTPVVVRVYSLTGRLVRVLADEVVEPGSYVIGWDGADATGRTVQPGVYIAVMTAGSYRGVQRLLIK
jgi:hypothetical protein